jgi:hypothetical protein
MYDINAQIIGRTRHNDVECITGYLSIATLKFEKIYTF